jgi:hypothetical protein
VVGGQQIGQALGVAYVQVGNTVVLPWEEKDVHGADMQLGCNSPLEKGVSVTAAASFCSEQQQGWPGKGSSDGGVDEVCMGVNMLMLRHGASHRGPASEVVGPEGTSWTMPSTLLTLG